MGPREINGKKVRLSKKRRLSKQLRLAFLGTLMNLTLDILLRGERYTKSYLVYTTRFSPSEADIRT